MKIRLASPGDAAQPTELPNKALLQYLIKTYYTDSPSPDEDAWISSH